jgi:hypothetical protein
MVEYLMLAVVVQDVTRLGGAVSTLICGLLTGVPLEMTVGSYSNGNSKARWHSLSSCNQFMTNPEHRLAHWLPMWSVRGVADWPSTQEPELCHRRSHARRIHRGLDCTSSSPVPRPFVSEFTPIGN